MASLEPARKKEWKEALASSRASWIVCGISRDGAAASAAAEGMAGLIDWMVHGQVSRLLQRGELGSQDSAVLPGDPARGRPSFLLFPVASGAKTLAEKIERLQAKEIAVAESTFPEDFLAKLKQTLVKEGIRCTKLEP